MPRLIRRSGLPHRSVIDSTTDAGFSLVRPCGHREVVLYDSPEVRMPDDDTVIVRRPAVCPICGGAP